MDFLGRRKNKKGVPEGGRDLSKLEIETVESYWTVNETVVVCDLPPPEPTMVAV